MSSARQAIWSLTSEHSRFPIPGEREVLNGQTCDRTKQSSGNNPVLLPARQEEVRLPSFVVLDDFSGYSKNLHQVASRFQAAYRAHSSSDDYARHGVGTQCVAPNLSLSPSSGETKKWDNSDLTISTSHHQAVQAYSSEPHGRHNSQHSSRSQPHSSVTLGNYSVQLNVARQCGNCMAFQTRQWVRGNGQTWLCHSCGQFWRKNGYARPKALWNRPTFKRSSRKRKSVNRSTAVGHSLRYVAKIPRDSVSSSYLKGKQMVEYEDQLDQLPMHSSLNDDHRILTLNGRTNEVLPALPQLRNLPGSLHHDHQARLPPMSLLLQHAARRGPYPHLHQPSTTPGLNSARY